jgi:hypothetical protein
LAVLVPWVPTNSPGPQLAHVAQLVAFIVDEYLPDAQGLQVRLVVGLPLSATN